LFELRLRDRMDDYGRKTPQFTIANFLHPHFKGDSVNADNNKACLPQTQGWMYQKYTTNKEEEDEEDKKSASQSILAETTTSQPEIDEWECCNNDRLEVMVALRSTTKTKTSLSTIEPEIDYYLTKADDTKKKFLTYCDVLEYWRGHEHIMPMLARLAREIFAILATSAPSERIFCSAGLIITESQTLLNTDQG